jgi:lipoate-protein ligase A
LTRTWRVERATGPAAELVARPVPDPAGRTVSLLEVTAPAVVLGSTQPDDAIDRACAEAAGLAVTRRGSGGGTVLVRPGELLWADVFVPAGDPLWTDDVGRAFRWLGPVWTSALRGLGVDARWHDGPPQETRWSRLVCFAGVGPGEVLVGERKVVGISQRRTRAGARFHCAALRAWDAHALLAVLALPDDARAAAATELPTVARGIDLELEQLEAALVGELAAAGG